MSEANKDVVRRVMNVFNTRDLSPVDQLVAEDVVDHNPFPGQAPGREGLKQAFGMILAAFPDQQYTIHEQLAEGDRVVTRWSARVTHGGPFMGMPPTGKQATVEAINFDRVVDGRMVETWAQVDLLSLL